MYYYAVKHKKEITIYSHKFKYKTKAKEWYKKKGLKIEKMLGRKLIFMKV